MFTFLRRTIGQRSPIRLAWHRRKAFAAALCYGFPARHLTVIGITGTDGKTTTVGMVSHILNASGEKTGALSTAFIRIGDELLRNETHQTSPSPFVIQRLLRRFVQEGCTHAVLEYSSHGLVQGRLGWTWPKIAAITNTSVEHLDYHGTMERYRADKARLFRMLRGRGTKVLNATDETYEDYRRIPSERTIAWAKEQWQMGNGKWQMDDECHGEVRAACMDSWARSSGPPHHDTPRATNHDTMWLSDVVIEPDRSRAVLHLVERATSNACPPTCPSKLEERSGKPWRRREQRANLSLSIPGDFNLENALAAIGCALGCGIGSESAVRALATFRGVPGRLERIDEGQPFAVYADYTVTPVAYEKTLKTLRSMHPGGRLLVLTGSCGDRMREKRPIVGKICSDLADVVVVTNEDPYTEDPETIIDEVFAGVDPSRCEALRISDRLEAIKTIFAKANPGDTVILCAKGADTTMWVKEGPIPWDEREIARGILREMRGK